MHDVGKVDARALVSDERGTRVVFYGHEKISERLTRRALSRLRYSSAFVDACARLVAHHMFNYESEWKDATVRRFMRSVGERHLDDLFALREADCRSRDLRAEIAALGELRSRVQREQAARHTITESDLAVDGRDVMHVLGIGPGSEVGRSLTRLLECVLDDPAMNERSRLLELLRGWRGKNGKAKKNRKPS
jgi:hypothetical protein